MNLCVAQIQPIKGDVVANIAKHTLWIERAAEESPDLILFPELSLTGYEPELAHSLSSTQDDPRFAVFQTLSNKYNLTICLGLPTRSEKGIAISMLIFQSNFRPLTYSKQFLHEDEKPFFVEGKREVIIKNKGYRIAPAICYESLLPAHIAKSVELNASIYLASVAKSQKGIDRANSYFPKLAKKHGMHIFMANCTGYCDNFESAGQSSIWNKNGELVASLSQDMEGLIVYDTLTNTAKKKVLSA